MIRVAQFSVFVHPPDFCRMTTCSIPITADLTNMNQHISSERVFFIQALLVENSVIHPIRAGIIAGMFAEHHCSVCLTKTVDRFGKGVRPRTMIAHQNADTTFWQYRQFIAGHVSTDATGYRKFFHRKITTVIRGQVNVNRTTATMSQSQNCSIQADSGIPLIICITRNRYMLTMHTTVFGLLRTIYHLGNQVTNPIFILCSRYCQNRKFAIIGFG